MVITLKGFLYYKKTIFILLDLLNKKEDSCDRTDRSGFKMYHWIFLSTLSL